MSHRLTADVIARSPAFLNPLKDRELDLRGARSSSSRVHSMTPCLRPGAHGEAAAARQKTNRKSAALPPATTLLLTLLLSSPRRAGNKIAVIENLAATQDQFDSIDLSDNEIRKVECMAVLRRLNQLLLNNNRITRISEGLGRALPKLESLILTNNQLATLTELEPLAGVPTLTALSLVDNPVTKVKDYRAFVIAMLPRLKVLDYRRVKLAEREAAEAAFRPSRRGAGPLKGAGGSSSGERLAIEGGGGEAAPTVKVAPTEEQVAQIKLAIGAASSLEEVQRLERALKAGQYDVIAAAAAAAQAAAAGS